MTNEDLIEKYRRAVLVEANALAHRYAAARDERECLAAEIAARMVGTNIATMGAGVCDQQDSDE